MIRRRFPRWEICLSTLLFAGLLPTYSVAATVTRDGITFSSNDLKAKEFLSQSISCGWGGLEPSLLDYFRLYAAQNRALKIELRWKVASRGSDVIVVTESANRPEAFAELVPTQREYFYEVTPLRFVFAYARPDLTTGPDPLTAFAQKRDPVCNNFYVEQRRAGKE